MRTYTSIHFDTEEQPAIEIRNGVDVQKKPYLVLDMVGINFFLEHWQLLNLRDKISAALASSPQRCGLNGCEEQVESRKCMSCDRSGCDEHMRPFMNDAGETEGYMCDPSCPAKAEVAA
jgi:hypothetical protein